MKVAEHNSTVVCAVAIVLIVLFAQLIFIGLAGDLGWDDGCITVSFARTFAESGRIALTPVSEQVEGSSTPLWFFALAGIYKVFHPGYLAMLQISQVLAAVGAALSCGLFYLLLRRCTGSTLALITAIVFGLCGITFSEVVNGMEMELLSLLVVLCLLALQRQNVYLAALAAALASMVRFEAAFYLVVAALVMVALRPRQQRMARGIAFASILSWSLVELWRWFSFHAILPNTILAKRWPPYIEDPKTHLFDHLYGGLEYYQCFGVLLLWLGWLYFTRDREATENGATTVADGELEADVLHFCMGYTLGVTVFSLVVGKNWGYLGRMQLSSFLPSLLLIFYFARRFRRQLAPVPTTAVLVVLWLAMIQLCAPLDTLRLVLHEHGVAGSSRALAAYQRERYHSYSVTPRNYALTGHAVDDVRQLLQINSIAFMTPDVGGASLCCERIRIVDSALLTNATLARHGCGAIASVLETENPEIVETHAPWTECGDIYRLPRFNAYYTPAIFEGNMFWFRNDVLKRLQQSRPSSEMAISDAASVRFRYFDENVRTYGIAEGAAPRTTITVF